MSESRSKSAFQSFVNEIADCLAVWYRLIEHTDAKNVPPLAFAYMSQAYANAKALHVIRALDDNAATHKGNDLDDDVDQAFVDFLHLNKTFLQDCADGASLQESKRYCVDLLEKLDKLKQQLS